MKNNPVSFADCLKKIKKVATQEELEALLKELALPALGRINPAQDPAQEHIPANEHDETDDSNHRTIAATISRKAPKTNPWNEVIDSENEAMTMSLYAKGLTTKDIVNYMKNVHEVDISQSDVSKITDKVRPLIEEWKTRPLSSVYPIVYLDAVRHKVRDNGKIISKAANIALGINQDGLKEVLGIWISDTEGAKFWLQVLNELKNRGVEDIFFTCVDGLKGFPEAIRAIYPNTEIQQCIVHQIRHTIKFVMHKDQDAFCANLRAVYTAPTSEAGLRTLKAIQEKWPQYLAHLQKWEVNWPELAPFFNYPEPIRKLIYTTNAIESLNAQFRKVTRTTVLFPHDDSLMKLLWLVQADISRRWTMPLINWRSILAQLAILFPDRMNF